MALYMKGAGKVRLARKSNNLIPYPYCESSKTHNGITFTINGKGEVKVSGTATSDAVIHIATKLILPKGEYLLYGGKDLATLDIFKNNVWLAHSFNGSDTSIIVDDDTALYAINLAIISGRTVDTIIKPMLVRGKYILPYEQGSKPVYIKLKFKE